MSKWSSVHGRECARESRGIVHISSYLTSSVYHWFNGCWYRKGQVQDLLIAGNSEIAQSLKFSLIGCRVALNTSILSMPFLICEQGILWKLKIVKSFRELWCVVFYSTRRYIFLYWPRQLFPGYAENSCGDEISEGDQKTKYILNVVTFLIGDACKGGCIYFVK